MITHEDILKLIPNIESHLSEMKEIEQEPIWHREGSVYNHTLMVVNEFDKVSNEFNDRDKNILLYATILHDIGKRKNTTSIKDNQIRHYGHSRLGYHIAMELLENVNLPFEDKLEILNLILYHGEPNWIQEKETIEQEYDVIKMSLDCNLRLLYHLTTFDFKGRIADDIQKCLENIDYFRLVAEGLNCFDNPYNFNSNLLKYKYLVEKTHHYLDIPFDDTKSKVYMLSGLPGSGKDTYIKNNLSHLPIISLDDIRKELKIKPDGEQGLVVQTAKERAKEFLRIGKDFVWNATNVKKTMRDSLISMFNIYNASIQIIYIHNDLKTIYNQNRNRETAIPENVITKLYRGLDIPKKYEAHEVVHITR